LKDLDWTAERIYRKREIGKEKFAITLGIFVTGTVRIEFVGDPCSSGWKTGENAGKDTKKGGQTLGGEDP